MRQITLASFGVALGLTLVWSQAATASSFTPLKWQQDVKQHPIDAFIGQQKHATWSRDKNRSFIDDRIEHLFKSGQTVNVVVDLNESLSPAQITNLLSKFGKIKYIGKLVTFVVLDDVRFDDLFTLAKLSKVAMIEWQAPLHLTNDISSRSIQARTSTTYSPNTAQNLGFTGLGVNIAIIDSGVYDQHETFSGKFVAGYDATVSPPIEANPPFDQEHGTAVAGIALGKGSASGKTCRTPDDLSVPNNCAGVAVGAGLVDVKVCYPCTDTAIAAALDWVGINAVKYNIRVANMSIAEDDCGDDEDGTGWMTTQVNHLVALGIAVTISYGNANPPPNVGTNCLPGDRLTSAPGSASQVMTVQASDDKGTVNREDDTLWPHWLSGPRKDFNISNPDVFALKPDFSAPGYPVFTAWPPTTDHPTPDLYDGTGGTSGAAGQVAGLAAILIEKFPNINPGSLKQYLWWTADSVNNTPTYSTIEKWRSDFGSGIVRMVNVSNEVEADLGFPNCIGSPLWPGGPCQVTAPNPPWDNSFDITTFPTPRGHLPTTITAQVRNSATVETTAFVNFAVYDYAAGNQSFYDLGTVRVTIPAMTTIAVPHSWTPQNDSHQCIQVSIYYGADANFGNNVTQRNVSVIPLVVSEIDPLPEVHITPLPHKVRIENPFMVPAKIDVKAKSDRDGWNCSVNEVSFTLHPFTDPPKKLQIDLSSPSKVVPGDRVNCQIQVYGTPKGSEKPLLIGGVTSHTFVPKPCRMMGQIVDEKNNPISKARILISRVSPPIQSPTTRPPVEKVEPITTISDDNGSFSADLLPLIRHTILVDAVALGSGQIDDYPECRDGLSVKYVLSRDGVRISRD